VERYKYRATSRNGRPIKGVLAAASEADLFHQLQAAGMELVQCSAISSKAAGGFSLGRQKVKLRDVIQFYVQLRQMQGAGIPLLDALSDIRDTADNSTFRDIIAECHRELSEGSSFSEAMSRHPKVFNGLQVSLMNAGEQSGDVTSSCDELIVFLKWVDGMQSRVRKATRYPMILMGAVILTVVVMMAFVVPQIVEFLDELGQELPLPTRALMGTSDFFVNYWQYALFGPIGFVVFLVTLRKMSDWFSYQVDSVMLKAPVMGPLIRKINIARFTQTFGALFSGGIDVLSALEASSETVGNKVLKEGLMNVHGFVKAGVPLSEALNRSGEFPSLVVRMVRVGEESGNLTEVLSQVSEFYTNDVDEEVQKVITMIEPSLTLILGAMILWIAVGVFGPIYASFGTMDF